MKVFLLITGLILALAGYAVIVVYRMYGGKSRGSIKTYSYPGRVADFITDVQRLSEKDSSVAVRVTDTTSDGHTGHRYYIKIRMKYLYNITCDSNYDSPSPQTKVDLILAVDSINSIGGYSRDKKSQPLIDYFDNHFIKRLCVLASRVTPHCFNVRTNSMAGSRYRE
jgi:hypothetical protein